MSDLYDLPEDVLAELKSDAVDAISRGDSEPAGRIIEAALDDAHPSTGPSPAETAAAIVDRASRQPAYRPPAQPPHGWESRQVRHYDPPDKTAIPATFSAKVVGVSFAAGYPGNLRALHKLATGDVEELRPTLILRHDPENPHDNNAVQVLAVRPAGNRMLGHLPRAVAPRIAGELDAGKDWRVIGYEVLEDPRHPDKPGLSINARRLDD